MRKFPDDFILGVATAASQIEGNDKNTNWYHWGEQGKIKGNGSTIVSADHYHKVKEDTAIMQSLNIDSYRMSIEWSRIYPKKNQFDMKGLEYYIDEVSGLVNSGIIPMVTLHHFSCPQWLQEEGGWLNKDVISYFIQFVEKVVYGLGDLCYLYCTINEPNVFCMDTYIDGHYPPGDKDNMKGYYKASKHMIIAHLKAYQLIHKIRGEEKFKGKTQVGFAHHLAVFDMYTKNPLTKMSKSMMDYSFHTIYFEGMVNGKLSKFMGGGYPEGKGTFCDYLGINYYSRHIIESDWHPSMLFGRVSVDDSKSSEYYTDLGWEIYPEGLYRVIKQAYDYYKKPIFITENGLADGADVKRGAFIEAHLDMVLKLIEEDIPVKGYYHWSLLDNLEWQEGYGPRFGLVEVDYDTLERHIRKSGRYYQQICGERVLIKWDENKEW